MQMPPNPFSPFFMTMFLRYPTSWHGYLALPVDDVRIDLRYVTGNPELAFNALPLNPDGSTPPLRIQRYMQLEHMEDLLRREHCMLLLIPMNANSYSTRQEMFKLQNGCISYLQARQVVGIMDIPNPRFQETASVIHMFPSCDFVTRTLASVAPDFLQALTLDTIPYLLIIITNV